MSTKVTGAIARFHRPVAWDIRTPRCEINWLMPNTPRLTLNLGEGSVSCQFTPSAAQELQSALTALVDTLKLKASQSGVPAKATLQAPMEYQYTGDVFLEIFCNPNIWGSPFAAKVLITLRDDRIHLSTEAELSRLIEAVNTYLEQVS